MEHQSAMDFIINEMRGNIPPRLKYHSLEHTLSVIKCVERTATRTGVIGDDLKLLLTAAAYHDSGFLNSYTNHEEEGCKNAKRLLPKFDFNAEQVEIVCNMIMATKVPQSPKTELEKLLCDADLDYLGGDDYYTISNKLYEELVLNGQDIDKGKWLSIQIKFLESHHYWTDWAKENLAPNKDKILKSLQRTARAS
ncbi:HD domain-containing protein [Owenweeksia hongkongensis]|uniref:HD domain-containing protein n=1 Tax=Owenweeksia hongkongensis TaxID=253245 RepID=UPI003A8FE155